MALPASDWVTTEHELKFAAFAVVGVGVVGTPALVTALGDVPDADGEDDELHAAEAAATPANAIPARTLGSL